MNGFPPGTPTGPPSNVTLGGIGHIVAGGIGFVSLISAMIAIARHYAAQGRTAMSWFSRTTALLFLVAFVGVASGSPSSVIILGFWAAVVLAWTWLAAVSLDLYRRTPLLTPAT